MELLFNRRSLLSHSLPRPWHPFHSSLPSWCLAIQCLWEQFHLRCQECPCRWVPCLWGIWVFLHLEWDFQECRFLGWVLRWEWWCSQVWFQVLHFTLLQLRGRNLTSLNCNSEFTLAPLIWNRIRSLSKSFHGRHMILNKPSSRQFKNIKKIGSNQRWSTSRRK